jgi:hypothetical protein
MFLIFPWLMPRFGFWMSLGMCVVVTAVSFVGFAFVLKRFGIELM